MVNIQEIFTARRGCYMKQNDTNTAIVELKKLAEKFREDREWKKFHTPHALAINITVEAAELLELFTWLDPQKFEARFTTNSCYREKIEEELGDVIHACLAFANQLELDVTQTFLKKLEKTSQKYPVNEVKGIATKHFKD